ncbi:hypothetical protein [Streptomyces sp. NBRC 109706]|uniref:hypothetical protein n=1 Tax=Streptomyces sp. NBRC 109706 TaxID=1550035 RepID=UPI000785CCEC|nr:hypothetical protein [Streptomyces sp. NBRC 109706]
MKLSRRRHLAIAAVTVGALAFPGTAVATQPATSAPVAQESGQVAPAATVTWHLVRAENPTQDQLEAYELITTAMNAAVTRYNDLSDLGKSITVHYDPSVPTADGHINGTIRFGNRAYMNERTALHEISHTIGVGQSGGWYELSAGGTWSGAQATALVRQYDGEGASISTGGGHFWPYGLNYDNEFSQTNADRHVRVVAAMVADGM